jgi:hypothetical protein
MGYHVKWACINMPSDTNENKYFDIREAPQRLRQLAEERERMYLGEKAYRTLKQRGQMKDILDDEVKRIQTAFRNLVKELHAKRYSDQEAHERAWQSLVRNWPFALDDGEPEKKALAEKEPSDWPSVVTVTAKDGRRYVLVYQEPMSEDFKRFVRTLQGEPDARKHSAQSRPRPGAAKGPFDRSKQQAVREKAKEILKKQREKAEQAKQPAQTIPPFKGAITIFDESKKQKPLERIRNWPKAPSR